MAHDREVAGLRCTQVLAHLSDYLDGELDPQTRAQVEAHVQGCDWCERFGGPRPARPLDGRLPRRLRVSAPRKA
jgi:hypothetical protein